MRMHKHASEHAPQSTCWRSSHCTAILVDTTVCHSPCMLSTSSQSLFCPIACWVCCAMVTAVNGSVCRYWLHCHTTRHSVPALHCHTLTHPTPSLILCQLAQLCLICTLCSLTTLCSTTFAGFGGVESGRHLEGRQLCTLADQQSCLPACLGQASEGAPRLPASCPGESVLQLKSCLLAHPGALSDRCAKLPSSSLGDMCRSDRAGGAHPSCLSWIKTMAVWNCQLKTMAVWNCQLAVHVNLICNHRVAAFFWVGTLLREFQEYCLAVLL